MKKAQRVGTQAIDVIVGANIKLQRLKRGISQTTLGDALNLTFQQIQKYEKGGNRVGAGTLVRIAEFLKVDIGVFFEGVPIINGGDNTSPSAELLTAPFVLRAAQGLNKIEDDNVKRSIVNLIEGLAGARRDDTD